MPEPVEGPTPDHLEHGGQPARVRRAGLAGAVAALVVLLGCGLPTTTPPGATTPTAQSGEATGARSPAGGGSGLRTCALSSLPDQAADTVRDIHRGGPFGYPRNDGVVFGNRQRVLPSESAGYYHEYTVVTPGSGTRGVRRIVAGGRPLARPSSYFYTGDHYETFCEITGADR